MPASGILIKAFVFAAFAVALSVHVPVASANSSKWGRTARAATAYDVKGDAVRSDLRRVRVARERRDIAITWRFAHVRTRKSFDGNHSACVSFTRGDTGRRTACIVSGLGTLPVRITSSVAGAPFTQWPAAKIERSADGQSITARFPFDALAIDTRAWNVEWSATWLTPVEVHCSLDNACLDTVKSTWWTPGRIRERSCAAHSPWSARLRGTAPGRIVALTFDDGPDTFTPQVRSVLERRSVTGTFFVEGLLAHTFPKILQATYNAGHEIGGHSWYHEEFPDFSNQSRTISAIKQFTGFRPCFSRPPYGKVDGGVLGAAHSLNTNVIMWSVDSHDYLRSKPSVMVENVMSKVTPGSIILMHDGGDRRQRTVAALGTIIDRLRARGYRFVTVSEALGLKTTFQYER